MKKILSRTIYLSLIVMAVSLTASAQVYVTVRPPMPVIVRPPAPTPAHVWIDEEWTGRGGAYVYAGGHWAVPPHPGAFWIPGRWAHPYRGWRWAPGHWGRRRRY